MDNQKQLWEELAKTNTKYYINSDYGKNIDDFQFEFSGWKDYVKLIRDDDLFPKKRVVLEVGCGNGRMTEFIALNAEKVVAIDISATMITEGKKRLKRANNIEWIETDGYTIPIPDQSVDNAFSYIVFQHFKTKEMINKNFDEVYRILKPNGIFKVLVRIDHVNLNTWWGGVISNEEYPVSIGFKLLKKEQIRNYGLWLWLQK